MGKERLNRAAEKYTMSLGTKAGSNASHHKLGDLWQVPDLCEPHFSHVKMKIAPQSVGR